MYQEIAVAKGPEYDRLNLKMDRCQENIETLSDEIQRLQGNLPHATKLQYSLAVEDMYRIYILFLFFQKTSQNFFIS